MDCILKYLKKEKEEEKKLESQTCDSLQLI